ncbi:DUF4190 domain-containing protein [Galbitalea sp. SE-J8]|uniref:DUF4190 domain-containing protein n=1 Tax=Galbitalea sp. SE-J8 TaxID=3054952 RepID=UPI00259D2BED|nr:DUF4190 domain-containing protein [Galbitalea sp. SE-J8]MDM4761444.1 DUF4190 domain-containing protein [Galbitalea sp. SE-J8]
MSDTTPPPPEPTPVPPQPGGYAPAPPAYGEQTAYGSQPGQQPAYGQQPGYGQPYAYPTAPKTNTLAIVSLVLSLVGVGLGGIITGHLALGQIKRTGEGGHGLALAGTIIGYVGVALGLLVIIGYVVVLAVFGAAWASTGYSYYN